MVTNGQFNKLTKRFASGMLCATFALLAPACMVVVDDDPADTQGQGTTTPGTVPSPSTTGGASTPGNSGSPSSTSPDSTGTSQSPEDIVKGACKNTLGIEMPEQCESLVFARPIEGMHNFRPFTAPLHSGSKILPNKLYRSDALHELTPAGVDALRKMGIKTIVDLRSEEEITDDPDLSIPGVRQWINFPIGHDPDSLDEIGLTVEDAAEIKRLFLAGEFAAIDAMLKGKNLDIDLLRRQRYEEFAFSFRESLAGFLRLLTDPAAFPLLFHCQGGKDRTGYVSALIQRIAGWDRRDIERDYISTNFFTYDSILPMYQSGVLGLRPVFGAHLNQIRAALDAVDAKYPVFEDYLKLELGLTAVEIEAIRKNLSQ